MAHEHLPQTQMALVSQPLPSTRTYMALTLQIPLLNFNMGARHNHCQTVDTVMSMGVDDMQHTMASPRLSQTMGTDIHLPFRLTSDNRQTKGWLLHRRVWQQTLSVWQQTSSRSGNRQLKGGFVIGHFSQ